MKMPLRTLLVIGICVAHFATSLGTEPIPSLDELGSVKLVWLKTGWMLDLKKDGSGKLTFGSNAMDVAHIPKASLNIRDIYSRLVPLLKPKSSSELAVDVALRKEASLSAAGGVVDDWNVLGPIFEVAKQKARPLNAPRFQQLLRDHPWAPLPQ